MRSKAASPGDDSYASFPATSWTLIDSAHGGSDQRRREIVNEMASRYWGPLYAFYRSLGQTRADAQDLVQGLLWSLIRRDKLLEVEARKGRFRDWLMSCARNYLIDQKRRAATARRRPKTPLLSLQGSIELSGDLFEPAGPATPDQVYHEAWRLQVLDRALSAVWKECELRARTTDYRIFLDYYAPPSPPAPTWKALAARYGLEGWKEATRRADWLKARLARAIRNEIRHYAGGDNDIDQELRDLLK